MMTFQLIDEFKVLRGHSHDKFHLTCDSLVVKGYGVDFLDGSRTFNKTEFR